MGQYFIDSSALAKCYIVEQGSAWARTLLNPAAANTLYAIDITEVEVTSAIVRRMRSGSLAAADSAIALTGLRNALHYQFRVAAVTAALLRSAIALVESHALRANDALQLASALDVNRSRMSLGTSPITLVSADQELNAAAAAEGLAVEDPNQHP